MRRSGIITLLTDFGTRDPYVAAMKAVILSICPKVTITDISHEIAKFNIRQGAYVLTQTTPLFPRGTIHVGVIDPGVGTKRRPIVVETKRSFYVGPDNGLLIPAASLEGIRAVYEITDEAFMRSEISQTFHGRDIFAPVAAHLARGINPTHLGPKITDYARLQLAKARVENDQLIGEILHIDGFGNIITSIPQDLLFRVGAHEGGWLELKVGRRKLSIPLRRAYGEVPKGSLLAIVGSAKLLEISINQGNAAGALGAKMGEEVEVRPFLPIH